MQPRAFDLIAFDGDDTLWHNERSYRAARARFRAVLTSAGVALTDEEIDEAVNRIEIKNLPHYGYGVSSFVLSLIETAIDLSRGRVSGGDLRSVIELAKHMLTEDIELFAGAREVVSAVAASYPLMLITMGDLLHQTSKLDRSGLRSCFHFVEVVSRKTPETYAAILSRHRIGPARFLMIGNSVRSDIMPVIEVGGWAAHVPAALTWSHEHAEVPASAMDRYFELAALDRVPALIEELERAACGR